MLSGKYLDLDSTLLIIRAIVFRDEKTTPHIIAQVCICVSYTAICINVISNLNQTHLL